MSDEADELRKALSSPVYEAAFAKVMTGGEMVLTDEERSLVRRVRELGGTQGPGLRMPWRHDPTVPADQRTPDG